MAAIKRIMTGAILLYRWLLSPWLGAHCRFTPTCSQYALITLERFGVITSITLIIRRLLKCHPWHAGGYDPVPELKNRN